MTTYTIQEGDTIQDYIDDYAAPGVTFVVEEGTYDGFRITGAKINGTVDSPIRFVAQGQVVLNPFDSDYEDTIRIVDADHIHIEGFVINGPDIGRRQAVHVHASPKHARYSHGFRLINCEVLPVRGDGVKLSETYDASIIGCHFSGRNKKDDDERLLDFNKFYDGKVIDSTFEDHKAINMKGGGVNGEIRGCVFKRSPKAIEIGGYEGSGYWDQINNRWAAKNVTISGNTFQDNDIYDLRFIDAHDCVAEDNGDLEYFFTSSVENNRGDFRCERLRLDGVLLFDLPDTDPDPDPLDPPDPVTPPEPVDPYRFEKGDGGKKVIKPSGNDWPTVTLVGFAEDDVDTVANIKSKSTVIIDLRKLNGPRLTFKGKNADQAWADNIVYE